MKAKLFLPLFFSAVFLLTHFQGRAQYLQTGVFTIDTLVYVNWSASPSPPCARWIWDFYPWNFPYVTGMDFYIKIDSIAGPANSIYLYCFPSITNDTVNPGDSILITSLMNDIYVYYNNSAALYISFLAIGTPTVSGEPYNCNYTYSLGPVFDGCGGEVYTVFYPDTAICYVDGFATDDNNPIQPMRRLNPYIFSDETGNYFLNLNLLSPSTFTLHIFSVDGKKISEKNYSLSSGKHQIAVYTDELDEGIYFCRLQGEGVNRVFKFVK
jgi:hypothetical protein